MLPLAIAAGMGAVGNLIGGIGAGSAARAGARAYGEKAQQGINQMRQGAAGSNAAFKPYTDMGANAVGQAADSVAGRQQAQTAAYQPHTAEAANAFLDPSAAYSTDQANRAIQASALAKGGVGGGLAKALSDNANKMAMTNWNNANAAAQSANAQNFAQQDTNYQRNNEFQQQQIGNWANLANMGLEATSTNQGNQLNYNNGINTAYQNWGANEMNAARDQAGIFGSTANAIGGNLGNSLGSIFGVTPKPKAG